MSPADAFKDETGRLRLSKTAVAEIGEQLCEDYQAFKTRDLAESAVASLFIDGIAERIRPGQKREPVLAAWGLTFEGRKVLLHLMAGAKEDAETVSAFFQDRRARGLADPLLVVSDGAPGVIKAIEVCFPGPARQRCLAHRRVNACVHPRRQGGGRSLAGVQGAGHGDLPGAEPQDRPRVGRWAGGRLGTELANAVAGFRDDFEACIAPLRLPISHRRATRTTNLLARLFVEARRRLKARARARPGHHPRRLRREGGCDADVRRHDPGGRALAIDRDHRVRAPPDGCPATRARPGLRGLGRPRTEPLKARPRRQHSQQQ